MIINSAIKRAKKIKSIRSKHGRKAKHELLISRSNTHISAYIIDLQSYNVLFSVSSMGKAAATDKMSKTQKSVYVGQALAQKCNAGNLKPVINVAQYKFHGRVKALIGTFFENLAK